MTDAERIANCLKNDALVARSFEGTDFYCAPMEVILLREIARLEERIDTLDIRSRAHDD